MTEETLFELASNTPKADRAALLDRESAGDPALRARVEALLATHDQLEAAEAPGDTAHFAAVADHGPSPVADDATVSQSPESEPRPAPGDGTTVTARRESAERPDALIAGRYQLLERIGEGSMGSVWMAQQVRPVKRRVALKLIKPGMDSRAVLVRFESERQALMDHPNIAKVMDAGTIGGDLASDPPIHPLAKGGPGDGALLDGKCGPSQSAPPLAKGVYGGVDPGRPFFVMELVKGVPITDFCDQLRLTVPERLAIFRQVCAAVQHAHQKGIIHRDLKPSNILVEAHDDTPVPKVIDFGLAKATSGLPLSEHSLHTGFGTVAGTPLYMAPEQASFHAIDVDTRADVYALGVVLYELLTGSTPIPREDFRRAALDEMFRMVRDSEPPAPSRRISSSDALPSLAANRHTEPARLGRFVKGDLDWVTMKALAKERQRRYETPSDLARDLERFLDHEPVSAGPPTAAYRVRKFVRRHRPLVIAMALVLLALTVGFMGTTLGLIEARGQERAAEKRLTQVEKVNEILGSIFKDLNPRTGEEERKPLSALLGERLDQATAQIEGEAIGDPLTVARMQLTLGEALIGLAYPEKAIEPLTRARANFTARLGRVHLDTLRSMTSWTVTVSTIALI